MDDNDITRLRQRLLAIAMVAGSLGVWAGHLGNVSSTLPPARYVAEISAHHTRFVGTELAIAIGAFLLIPGMAGLMRLAPARGGRWATIGGVLAGIALAGLGAGNLMFGVVLGMLTPVHSDLATQVVRIANDEPLAGLPFLPAPLLTIGLVLVGVGLAPQQDPAPGTGHRPDDRWCPRGPVRFGRAPCCRPPGTDVPVHRGDRSDPLERCARTDEGPCDGRDSRGVSTTGAVTVWSRAGT